MPALVNFDVKPGVDLGAIQQRVEAVAPGARIAAHQRSRGTVAAVACGVLQWVAFGLVLLLSAAASAAVVLAARGALDTHRFTIEVMHGIGATDLQVTNLFQRKIAIDALVGSARRSSCGRARASCCFPRGAAFAGELTGGATLRIGRSGGSRASAARAHALATWVARTAVLTALREAL